jgi:hypothetical protein
VLPANLYVYPGTPAAHGALLMPSKGLPVLSFVACLTDRGDCLKFDNEGSARLTLDLSASEAVKVAAALASLCNAALGVAIKPVEKGK